MGKAKRTWTPTISIVVPLGFEWRASRLRTLSAIEAKLTYIRLSTQTPCLPHSAVPVNQGARWEAFVASLAVGLGVDLVTDWTKRTRGAVYLTYNGNKNTIGIPPRMQFVKASGPCTDYPLDNVGEAQFKKLWPWERGDGAWRSLWVS